MTITKISYSKTVESQVMGAGVWQKIGVDADVSEGEDIAAAIDEVRNVVEDAHKKYLPPTISKNAPERRDMYFNETTRKYEP